MLLSPTEALMPCGAHTTLAHSRQVCPLITAQADIGKCNQWQLLCAAMTAAQQAANMGSLCGDSGHLVLLRQGAHSHVALHHARLPGADLGPLLYGATAAGAHHRGGGAARVHQLQRQHRVANLGAARGRGRLLVHHGRLLLAVPLLGVVRTVVPAAALSALQRARHRDLSHSGQVEQLHQLSGVAIGLERCLGLHVRVASHVERRLQLRRAAHDAAVAPHHVAQLCALGRHPGCQRGRERARAVRAREVGARRRVVQLAAAVAQRVLRVRDAGPHRAVRKHQPLQQGVGGQAVGAVQARARHLAAGVQPLHIGLSQQTSCHAATRVVLRRQHGDGVLGDVEAQLRALGRNVGEVVQHLLGGLVRDVEKHVRVAALHQLVVDRARHDVTRRQLHPLGVVLRHEPLAAQVVQLATLTAYRLRNEEGAALAGGVVQRGGVELDELHVAHARVRAERHGDAIAGRHVRVGGVGVHLARATARQHGGQRDEPGHGHCALVQHVGAKAVRHALVLVRHQVHRQVVLKEADVGVRARGGQQRALNLAPRQVRRVHHAPLGVAALLGQVQAAVLVARELGAHLHQLQHTRRPLAAHHLHGLRVVEEGASDDGVTHVL
mmetsp:Transcript_37468/g.94563  ORF Transcript_37468/g.94563 Transcript_37468/m.94563 type:complete len:610 (-) Transcript_37468:711-2540(-)